MSKKHFNYSQQYNKHNDSGNVDTVNNAFVTGVTVDPVINDPEPTPPTDSTPEPVYGVVVGCKALNVREETDVNSVKICVLPAGTKVEIMASASAEWFHVCTEAGLEGYCLSEFISIE